MKSGYLALALFSVTAAYAQVGGDPNADFSDFETDVLVADPRFTLSTGFRGLSGAKSTFSGSGRITAFTDIGPATGSGISRIYHDGSVRPDTRTFPLDDGNGGTINVPITPDGRTNSWGYLDSDQVLSNGNMAFHSYSAEIVDAGKRSKNPTPTYGLEVAVNRRMGQLTTRLNWNLQAGVSLNDLNSRITAQETANITTVTDEFSLGGAPAPELPGGFPYNSGGFREEPLFDEAGNRVVDENGFERTRQVENTVLIADAPESRTTTVTTDSVSVNNHFKVKGAYFTFRAGPTIVLPIKSWLTTSFSAGAAMVYAGSTYSVQQRFQPETGAEVVSDVSSSTTRLLPGYFADANVQLWLTNRTGFFAGAVFQSTGSFSQAISTPDANYATEIDMKNMSGFHMGLNVKF